MDHLKVAQRRHIIGQFFYKNYEHGISYTGKYFLAFGIARSTIYNITSTLKKRGNLNRKFGSGRKSVKMPKRSRRSLLCKICNKIGVSNRKIAWKFDISQSYDRKIIKENGVTYRIRKRVPDSKPEQELRAKSRCLKLRRDFFPPSSITQISHLFKNLLTLLINLN